MHLTNFHFYNSKNYLYNKLVKGLQGCGLGYRFSFNGKELDNETYGEGNACDFGARIYDSRLGRWLSTDPLESKYPFVNPYNGMLNSPLQYKDIDGADIILTITGSDNKAKTACIIKTNMANITYNLPFKESQFPNGTFKEPFKIQGPNKTSDVSAMPDAKLFSLDAGVTAGGGVTVSAQVAFIYKGDDAGGIFLYTGGGVSAGLNAGVSVTAGNVEFNEQNSQNLKLDRNTFLGKSQGGGIGFGSLSYGEISGYTDGKWCTGGTDNCSDKLFTAEMSGTGAGIEVGVAYSWTDNGSKVKELKAPNKKTETQTQSQP